MKKIIIGGALAAAVAALVAQVLPDIRRYVRMRCM
ncbi:MULTISPECIES: DUF6893 family small protein [unclassified Streptomyces]